MLPVTGKITYSISVILTYFLVISFLSMYRFTLPHFYSVGLPFLSFFVLMGLFLVGVNSFFITHIHEYLIMSIDIITYKVKEGLFGPYQVRRCGCKPFTYFDLADWLSILLLLAGDVHESPKSIQKLRKASHFAHYLHSKRTPL